MADLEAKVLSESQRKIVFAISNASLALLNALRRTIVSELPCFAVDEVSFFENTSPLFNEYIANRVGLVPLTYEEGVSDDAKIAFELNAEATDGERIVYSRELVSTDPVIKVFCERIPLVKLGKGQKLRLEATAVKGTAKQHAKFQSALASYGMLPDFKVSQKCNKCGACIKACPQKIIEESKGRLRLSAPEKCLLCEACVEACSREALSAKASENEFVFFIESFNNLTARQQLERALALMNSQTDEVIKSLR